jgi:peptide/nickel transport system permease protein
LVAGIILLALAGAAVLAPVVAPFDPYEVDVPNRLKSPSLDSHLLGTDYLGRDILSRLLYGGRISLLMAFLPVISAMLIGAALGMLAGFAGRTVNAVIMRTMDVFYAFPSVLLGVAFAGAMGGGTATCILALTMVFTPGVCRVAETATTQIRSREFVDAARATGASSFAIIRHHIVGNVFGSVFVYSSTLVSASLLIASGLSFLGLGPAPPVPEWGAMLATLSQSIYINPIGCALPGAAIFVTSMCVNLFSDGLQTAMNVRAELT